MFTLNLSRSMVSSAFIGFLFVQPVFAETPSNDQDGDGIVDSLDVCSETAAGAPVWKTGPWAGCADHQSRDGDLFAGIVSCQNTTDSAMDGVHIYVGSSCAVYGNAINDATTPYVALAREDNGRGSELSKMGNKHLAERYSKCQQASAAVFDLIAQMNRSGCSSSPSYPSYSSGGSYSTPSSNSYPTPSVSSPSHGGGYVPGVIYTHTGGSTTIGSDGTIYNTNGNTTVSSSGVIYTTNGNTTVSSTGVIYTTNGNTTVGSNGTMCITNGNITTCS